MISEMHHTNVEPSYHHFKNILGVKGDEKMGACEVLAQKVAPIYRLLDWRWCDEGVPSEEQICTTLHTLLKELRASKKNITSISTGGLVAHRSREQGNREYDYDIAFTITEGIENDKSNL